MKFLVGPLVRAWRRLFGPAPPEPPSFAMEPSPVGPVTHCACCCASTSRCAVRAGWLRVESPADVRWYCPRHQPSRALPRSIYRRACDAAVRECARRSACADRAAETKSSDQSAGDGQQ